MEPVTRKTGKMAVKARQQMRAAKLAKYKRELAEAGVKLGLPKPSEEARRQKEEELKKLYTELFPSKSGEVIEEQPSTEEQAPTTEERPPAKEGPVSPEAPASPEELAPPREPAPPKEEPAVQAKTAQPKKEQAAAEKIEESGKTKETTEQTEGG